MKHPNATPLEGRVMHLIYSPRGDIEGVLLASDDGIAQLVVERGDAHAATALLALSPGQAVALLAEPLPPSPKGRSPHAILALRHIVAIHGRRVATTHGALGYRGRVQRFNYARHGAINGVVLDTGDFLHLKPEGYERSGLQIGDEVTAQGDAHRLADGHGWAVEARVVNGRAVAAH